MSILSAGENKRAMMGWEEARGVSRVGPVGLWAGVSACPQAMGSQGRVYPNLPHKYICVNTDLSFFPFFFLFFNGDNIKHTILTTCNCTVQQHQVHSHCCATSTTIRLLNVSRS